MGNGTGRHRRQRSLASLRTESRTTSSETRDCNPAVRDWTSNSEQAVWSVMEYAEHREGFALPLRPLLPIV